MFLVLFHCLFVYLFIALFKTLLMVKMWKNILCGCWFCTAAKYGHFVLLHNKEIFTALCCLGFPKKLFTNKNILLSLPLLMFWGNKR